jgi:N-acetylneuraminic acid mutarotase
VWKIAGVLTMMAAGGIEWKEAAPLPVGIVGAATGMAGGRLLIAGGTYWKDGVKTWSSRADRYDAKANRWDAVAPLPRPVAYGASLGGPDGLEIFGGNDGSRNFRECLVLNAKGGGWRVNGMLPEDRLMAGPARAGDTVYLAGGCADAADLSTCSDAVLARTGAGAWKRVGAIPSGIVGLPATAVVKGRLWMFGGAYFDSAKVLHNRAEAWSWDPASGKWTALRPLAQAARGIAAVAYGRYVLLIGGYTGTFLDTVLAYDTERDTYTPWTPLPHAVLLPGVGLDGDTLLLAGGEDQPKHRSARAFTGLLPGRQGR